jgi:SAM-dependent MidA family methyltransferase
MQNRPYSPTSHVRSSSMSLADALRMRIAADGPMVFEEFMRACLYDPDHGFFATGPLRSTKGGDFLTSPEVSPWFGTIIGRHVAAEHRRLDVADFVLAEVGAGSGSLIGPLVKELGPAAPEVWALDASPAARRSLGERIASAHVAADIDDLPDYLTGVIVANELLDNLPVALALRAGNVWQERRVAVNDHGRFVLVPTEARAEVAAWADRYCAETPEGGLVEVQLEAETWLRSALRRLHHGTLLAFDYGGTAEELVPRRTQGTLRTYRAHHLGPEPLEAPGESDVTADVNFSALETVARREGAEVELLRQDDYLRRWGLGQEISQLRHRELALARDGDPIERLQVRSERTDAETLVHPRGLGDFRVLVAQK